MKYKATIKNTVGTFSREFSTLNEAAEWLDSENNNLENDSYIETVDGDSIKHTEKANG